MEAYITSEGKFSFSHWLGGEPVSSTTLQNNVWYSLAFSYDYTTSEGKVYIDGVLEGTNTLGFHFGPGGNYSPANFLVGKCSDPTTTYFDGNMDEIRVWNTSRTQSEIQNNMSTSLSGSESGLVGYWNFNEGEGNTLYDLSGNENNGTINGDPQWVNLSLASPQNLHCNCH